MKGRTGLFAYQSAPCPSVRLDPAFVWLLSAAFVTSECVFGAPADACMKLPSFYRCRRAPLNQLILYDIAPLQGFFLPLCPTLCFSIFTCTASPSVRTRVHSIGSMYTGAEIGRAGLLPPGFIFSAVSKCGWPVSRVLSRAAPRGNTEMAIHLGPRSPTASCGLPGQRAGGGPGLDALSSLSDLAPGGACHAAPVAGGAVGSYPAVSPLPEVQLALNPGGLFSVALSLRFGVSPFPRRALPGTVPPWSPDFPRGLIRRRGRAAIRPSATFT